VFAFMVGAILFGTHALLLGRRPKSVLLASLAGRWNGRVHEGGMLAGDRLELGIDGVAGEVTFGESPQSTWESAGWTRVRFDWPSERRLRLCPEGGAGVQLRRLFGGTDIEFDDPAFDDRFWVESSHPTWARALLDPAARRAFVKLQWSPKGPFSDALSLDVGPSGISVRVSRVLVDNAEALGWFVETCVSLLQKARALAESTGVTLEPIRAQADSACPVCGHPVAEALFPCPVCRTPHHRDCWRYFGGCAIFGCRTRMRS
jgi:hypothetical protein